MESPTALVGAAWISGAEAGRDPLSRVSCQELGAAGRAGDCLASASAQLLHRSPCEDPARKGNVTKFQMLVGCTSWYYTYKPAPWSIQR